MKRIAAILLLSIVPLVALAQGVDNPGSNYDLLCNMFGMCNPAATGGVGSYLLLESGDHLLLESGGKICLEGSATC